MLDVRCGDSRLIRKPGSRWPSDSRDSTCVGCGRGIPDGNGRISCIWAGSLRGWVVVSPSVHVDGMRSRVSCHYPHQTAIRDGRRRLEHDGLPARLHHPIHFGHRNADTCSCPVPKRLGATRCILASETQVCVVLYDHLSTHDGHFPASSAWQSRRALLGLHPRFLHTWHAMSPVSFPSVRQGLICPGVRRLSLSLSQATCSDRHSDCCLGGQPRSSPLLRWKGMDCARAHCDRIGDKQRNKIAVWPRSGQSRSGHTDDRLSFSHHRASDGPFTIGSYPSIPYGGLRCNYP